MATGKWDVLVNQDVCVLGGPPWLLAFVLESITQRIRPEVRQPQPDG